MSSTTTTSEGPASIPPSSGTVYRLGARLIWRIMRTHPGPFAVAVTGAVMFAAAAVGATIAVGRVTDSLIDPAFAGHVRGSSVVVGVAIVAALGIVRGGSIIVRRYFAAMVDAGMQSTLRLAVVDKYLTVPLEYHHVTPTGELLAHADSDVIGVTNMIKPLPFSIGVAALVVFAMISLILVDWTFAVVALVLFPALTALNRIYTSRIVRPVGEVQTRLGDVSSIAHESFDGALVIKSLGREDAETERFAVSADRLRASSLEVGVIRSLFEPMIDALPNLGILLLLVVGAWRLQSGAVSVGDIVQASLLFSILAFPMRVFGFFLQELPRAVVSIDRIDTVLAEPDAAEVIGAHTSTLPAGPLGVEVEGLGFGYDGPDVLSGVTFSVSPGESVAIVGPTGSGKSTLVSLLVRLMEPTSGSISIGGVPISEVAPDELRSAVALVFQESFLFASSIEENIGLGRAAPDAVQAAAEVARVRRFVDLLPHGWDTVIGERGVTLSGGQRQRIALARALARKPRVLILDDSTSAVDPTIEAEILAGIGDGDDVTLLVIAHRLSTIRLADRVAFVDGGRLVAIGTHDELLAEPGYLALVSAYESDDTSSEVDDDELAS